MLLAKMFERFEKKTPVTVMARAAMEHALNPTALDELFAMKAEQQYTRELLFSSVVDLMAMVVAKIEPSVNAAYQSVADTLPVSITAVYDKLSKTEPGVSAALVSHTADRLGAVISSMGGELEPLLPGYRVRILDGNHFPATERRLSVLRRSKAGPLPGQALVVLDPALMLATDMIPCEDAHAQERALSTDVVELVSRNDVWIADRNFCTSFLLRGIASKAGYFAIRAHAKLPLRPLNSSESCGRTETGAVTEHEVLLELGGEPMTLRRVAIQLDKPTRDKDNRIEILTNLPKDVSAVRVVELYRKRWTLETMFQSLTTMLASELNTLGYPRAALLAFAVALATYNVMSTVQASLRAQFGADKVQEEVSGFYIANEVRKCHEGMSVAIPEELWIPFQTMSPHELAQQLVAIAANTNLKKLKRHPRGEKKPVPKRTRHTRTPHVSTARLLSLKE